MRRKPVIRVIVADDHHLVRQGIRALLEKASDIEVIGEAADGREAVELVERLAPAVLVMDIAMPRLDGTRPPGGCALWA
jgi:DNA-binding NarL/FixJ family response regulator